MRSLPNPLPRLNGGTAARCGALVLTALAACGSPTPSGPVIINGSETAGGQGDTGDIAAASDTTNDTAETGSDAVLDSGGGTTDGGGVTDAAVTPDTVDIGAGDVAKDIGEAKPCSFDASFGASGKECPDDYVCVAEVGACSGVVQGLCKPVITSCVGVGGEPVCDCKGKTWSNACEAQLNLQTIASSGACASTGPTPCGGNTGGVCPLGQVCEPASCTANAAGICVPDPTGGPCPNGGTPECGCDGKTYPNACYRLLASVSKASTGACPADPGAEPCKIGPAGKQIGSCPAGTWCQVYTTNPIPCTGEGECVKETPVCDETTAPVCGCDFQTYGSACKAALAKANVKGAGGCGGGGCTEGGGGCGDGQYCAVAQGQCGGLGVCIGKADPKSCTGVIDPVCGCDNKTYANAGCAAVEGVVVKAPGACK